MSEVSYSLERQRSFVSGDTNDAAASLPNVAVVIPAYNEATTIRDVVKRALAQVSRVIVVDDGSTDETRMILRELPVTVLCNPRNRGKGASLWRGMEHAFYQGVAAVITLDADGQHQPEDIPRLLRAWRAHPQMIINGTRLHEKAKIPLARYRANRVADFWISWAAGYRIVDSQCGFRLYPTDILRRIDFRRMESRFAFESEVLILAARAGVQSLSIPIPAIYSGHARPSHFRPVVDIARIGRVIAWKLISRGLYPVGLVRSLRTRSEVTESNRSPQ